MQLGRSVILFFFIACSQETETNPMQLQIDELKARVEVLEQKELQHLENNESVEKLLSKVKDLDIRIAKSELAISTLQQEGLTNATYVYYDPRGTKLSKTNIQDAMTELENRLDEFEAKMLDGNLGKAGPGLYNVGHDKIKNQLELERRKAEEKTLP